MDWYKLKVFFRFYSHAIISVTILVVISLLVYREVRLRVDERNSGLFSMRSQAAQEAIEKRIQDYIQILKGAQALVLVSDSVKQEEWKGFVAALQVPENYPGVQGIGYAIVVGENRNNEFEKDLRNRGLNDFFIWPKGQEAYTAIIYLEPQNSRNKRAFGYDMFSDSTRREAMEKARDTGKPAMSRAVVLVQETDKDIQKGFNLYLPLYESGSNPQTVAERRATIKGFVYSPFRIGDLMDGILGSNFEDLDLRIYEGDKVVPSTAIYRKLEDPSAGGIADDALQKAITINIAENTWTLLFTAHPDFGYETSFPFMVLSGGLLVSVLIFLIILSYTDTLRSNYLKQVITDNATSALFILDKKGNCTFMNPAARQMTGYTYSEIKKFKLAKLLHSDSHNTQIEKALFSDVPVKNIEDTFIVKSGKTIHVSINSKPIVQGSKKTATLLDVRDISQQKAVENTLRENNNNLKTLNRIGRDLSAELELNKLLQTITDACTELTEAEFGAFLYKKVTPEDQKVLIHILSGSLKEEFEAFLNSRPIPPGLIGRETILLENVNGDPEMLNGLDIEGLKLYHLPIKSYLFVPVISRYGEVIGGLFFGHTNEGKFSHKIKEIIQGIAAQAAIAIDNSRLFETISAKNKELVKINNDLDNFVYTASHDLKAPVLNIEGLVYALIKTLQKKDFDKAHMMIEMIKTSILKFKGTIQALTEVAKTNKNIEEDTESINLQELLDDIKLSIEDMILKANAKIIADLDCKPIQFSKNNIRSIMLNLITNAIKYSSPERSPVIIIRCHTDEENIFLTVTDNGLGIQEEHYEKIFLMFKRVHTAAEGTGVGLYLVKRIVENHHGTITVKSKVGEGSRFDIQLPIVEVAHAS